MFEYRYVILIALLLLIVLISFSKVETMDIANSRRQYLDNLFTAGDMMNFHENNPEWGFNQLVDYGELLVLLKYELPSGSGTVVRFLPKDENGVDVIPVKIEIIGRDNELYKLVPPIIKDYIQQFTLKVNNALTQGDIWVIGAKFKSNADQSMATSLNNLVINNMFGHKKYQRGPSTVSTVRSRIGRVS